MAFGNQEIKELKKREDKLKQEKIEADVKMNEEKNEKKILKATLDHFKSIFEFYNGSNQDKALRNPDQLIPIKLDFNSTAVEVSSYNKVGGMTGREYPWKVLEGLNENDAKWLG